MTEPSEQDETSFALDTSDEFVLPGDEGAMDLAGPNGAIRRPVRRTRPPGPTFLDRRAAKRLRARKVRRLVRHIEPWSVLKISLIFYFCLWVIVLIAGVILWNLAVSSGTIDNVENFIEQLFALESFAFNGDQIFRAAAVGGLVLVVAGAGFTVLMAVLFNLISDITGGVRLTVVEEETARPRPRRTRPRRGVRPTPAYGTAVVPPVAAPGLAPPTTPPRGSPTAIPPASDQPSISPAPAVGESGESRVQRLGRSAASIAKRFSAPAEPVREPVDEGTDGPQSEVATGQSDR